MSRCARERPVWFVEEPTFETELVGGKRLDVSSTESGVSVVVPRLLAGISQADAERAQSELLDSLLREECIDDFVLWFYTPMPAAWTEHLDPRVTVYDCMDELTKFAEAPPELGEREQMLLARADVVFTGGASLYESKRERHPNVHLLPSSVDAAHFRQARDFQSDPQDQSGLRRPRLGFYGVLDERMDFRLLSSVARSRPEWEIVVVGPAVPKFDSEDLAREPNIHYLGGKQYDELPAYLAGWDVALIPFALNEATEFISPTKTPEYLAAGKPVVSTPIRDVVRPWGEDGLVHIASSSEEFVAAIEQALEEDHEARMRRVDLRLAALSWDTTWAAISEHLDAAGRSRRPRRRPIRRLDWLIVGAGFAGSVLAERLADAGSDVLLVDRRPHIAGNAFDHYDEAGILVHRYGPHIFHTNCDRVVSYLSRFTEWRPYEHRVRASVDGKLLPMPINLTTINELYGLDLTPGELTSFLAERAEPVSPVRTAEDVVLGTVGRDLYERFFRGYTRKQWGLDPSELDASVTARVPTRTNRDDRYFTDSWQAMPKHGYTRMFERMVTEHPRIRLMLNTDYREIEGLVPHGRMVYTGPIDEFFDYCYGSLPYRSLEFRHMTHDRTVFQDAPVVNYPNDHDYTRVTEFKYLTGQEHPKTSIVFEYPRADGDPYYPVPRPENRELYKAYKELADATPEVEFVGRLATYKYYNMDQVVAQALAVFDRLCGRGEPASYGAARHSASVASAASRLAKNSISLPSRRPQGR
jgi:UDP-galactopyranose mutase